MKIPGWIRESNLIEDIDNPKEDRRSYMAWLWFKKQPLTLESIKKVHRRITWAQLKGKDRGNWRICNVRVGSRICPHYENVPGLMQEWINHNHNALNKWTIKQAHIEFEKIHPFRDGNGRTGRMIMNHQRNTECMSPLLIKVIDRQEYYSWFEEELPPIDYKRMNQTVKSWEVK